METFNHLRSRSTKTQGESPITECIETGGGHRKQGRGAGINRHNARSNFDSLRQGCEVSHKGRSIEAVGLSHPNKVEACLFHRYDSSRGFSKTACVTHGGSDFHRTTSSTGRDWLSKHAARCVVEAANRT
jgi:hypothetical protein